MDESNTVHQSESGIALLLLILSVLTLLMLSALVIDSGVLMARKMHLELVLDASALRGAQAFHDVSIADGALAADTTLELHARALASANLKLSGYPPNRITNFNDLLQVRITQPSPRVRRIDLSGALPEQLFLAPMLFKESTEKTLFGASAAVVEIPDPNTPGNFPHILIAFDTSCSMRMKDAERLYPGGPRSSRLQNGVAAIRAILDLAPEGTVFGAVTFDRGSGLNIPPVVLDQALDGPTRILVNHQLQTFLDTSHTRCYTDMPDGIAQLHGILEPPTSLYRNPDTGEVENVLIVLVTDGIPTGLGYNARLKHPNPNLDTPAEMRDFVDANGSIDDFGNYGRCTSYGNNTNSQLAGQIHTFAAAQMLRNSFNVAINGIGFGLSDNASKLMRSTTNVEGDPSDKISLPCKAATRDQPASRIGRNPTGPEGKFFTATSDFVKPFKDLVNDYVGTIGARRVHYQPEEVVE